jgi:hypothetical protein
MLIAGSERKEIVTPFIYEVNELYHVVKNGICYYRNALFRVDTPKGGRAFPTA